MPRTEASPANGAPLPPTEAPKAKAPRKPSKSALLGKVLEERFGFKKFLPGQKAACSAVVSGKDSLLALPAGAGKSQCYLVAGLALEGATIVASARTEWMEQQVAQLRERGMTGACIHAGRDRDSLRAACVDYLNGRLQFLYVAPERFGVAGFPQMLAKRKPVLVAIEEAERIVPESPEYLSDYALLRDTLPLLRPAPVLALTTAETPSVLSAISHQLGLTL